MPSLGALGKAVLELATDDAALEKGLAAAHEKSKIWGAGVSGAAKGAALAIAGVGAAATGIIGAMVASAHSVQNQAIEIDTLRRETGLSIEEASKLKYAAGRLNIDTTALSTSFGVLSHNIALNTKLFQAEHVEVVKTKDGHVDLEATTAKLADRFKAMPDGVEKTALAMTIFGRSGKDMIPLLNEGSAGLKAMGDEATTLGLVFDNKTVAASYRLRDAQKTLSDHIEGLKNRIGIAFMPTLAEWTGGLVNAADVVLPSVTAALSGVGTFITDHFAPVFTAVKDTAKIAFDTIGAIIGDFKKDPRVGSDDLFEGLFQMFGVKLPGSVHLFVADAFQQLAKLPGFISQVVGSIGEIFDVATGRRPEAGGMLRSLVGDAKATDIMGTVARVRDAMVEAFDFVKPIIQGVIDKVVELKGEFDKLPPALQGFAAAAIVGQATGFNGWLLSAASNVSQVGQGVVEAARGFPGFITGVVGIVRLLPTWIGLQSIAAGEVLATIVALLPFIALGVLIGIAIGLLITHWDDFSQSVVLVGKIIGVVLGKIGEAIGAFLGFWIGVWTEISSKPGYYLGLALGFITGTLLNIAEAIGDFAGGAVKTVVGWLGDTKTNIWDFFGALPGAIGGFLLGAVTAIGQFELDALAAIVKWIGDTKTTIWNFFTGLPDAFSTFAVQAVQGLANGFGSMVGWITDQVKGFFGGIVDGVKAALGIHSPSTVFHGIGTEMMLGLAAGISANAGLPQINLDAAIAGLGSAAGTGALAGMPAAGVPTHVADRPIIIQNDLQLKVEGRELARASTTWDNSQARRYGYGIA